MIDIKYDNYSMIRAAWTAMDKTAQNSGKGNCLYANQYCGYALQSMAYTDVSMHAIQAQGCFTSPT